MRTLKYSFLFLIATLSISAGSILLYFYFSVDFSKPFLDEVIIGLCGDLIKAGVEEKNLDQCRGEAALTYRGMLYMWYFGLPAFLLWLLVPAATILYVGNWSKKRIAFFSTIHVIMTFVFYLFWIKT